MCVSRNMSHSNISRKREPVIVGYCRLFRRDALLAAALLSVLVVATLAAALFAFWSGAIWAFGIEGAILICLVLVACFLNAIENAPIDPRDG